MTKSDAIITLCKEFPREMTRRQYLAVCKALGALDLDNVDRADVIRRWGFYDNGGNLRSELQKQERKPKVKKFDWSNVR